MSNSLSAGKSGTYVVDGRILDLDSDAWASVLRQGLGAHTLPVETSHRTIVVTVFTAGPFKIAYPDFPTGAVAYSPDELGSIMKASRVAGADLVRVHSQVFLKTTIKSISRRLDTTLISDLGSWSDSAFQKSRRAKNRHLRSDLEIGPLRGTEFRCIYDMYVGTLSRKHGTIRYSAEYFRSLPSNSVLVARLRGEPCGFVCYAKRGNFGYYLHGGHAPSARAHYPSDQLFLTMLRSSKDAGLAHFDFLPSPPGQPDLERYKRSWGGNPAEFIVTDLVINPFRSFAFSSARSLADRLPRQLVTWVAGRFTTRV